MTTLGNIEDLWHDYRPDHGRVERDRLLLHYSPLVKFIAGRVGSGMSAGLDRSDLISYGVIGLIDAIDKFDPDRGFKFETYAKTRIRGAILDGLRSLDWAPRSLRSKSRAIDHASLKLNDRLRRTPDRKDVAAELGVTDVQLAETLGRISRLEVVALHAPLDIRSGHRGGATVGDVVASAEADPGDVLVSQELAVLLADTVSRLSDRARFIVALYYYERLTLAEIGRALDLSESRVSQINKTTVMKMYSMLTQ